MDELRNELDQPVGFPVADWQPSVFPPHTRMEGCYCDLAPLDAQTHAQDLYDAFGKGQDRRNWTYLPYGPFDNFDLFNAWLKNVSTGKDPQFYAIQDKQSGVALGMASYCRMQPSMGVIEVGHIHYSPLLQKTPMATEAMYLMMKQVFDDLGYRRYEWKCDALNAPSRKAALRLGFSFEGIFRQALIYKGRNRDSAWFSVIDKEWPALKSAFQQWLCRENFNTQGRQKQDLRSLQKQNP